MTPRLILAIVSTILEEIALVVLWKWGLPQLGIQVPLYVLIVVMSAWAIYAVTTFCIVTRTINRKVLVGLPSMVGSRGKVASPLALEGLVRIKSELWSAKSLDDNIDKGEKITVVGQDGLKLIVRKDDTDKPKRENEKSFDNNAA